jgi:hypothetical protein
LVKNRLLNKSYLALNGERRTLVETMKKNHAHNGDLTHDVQVAIKRLAH